GQHRREADILAAAADGEAELALGHDDLDAPRLLVEHDLGHLGRREGIDDEGRRIGRPWDDVDLLALQFADHGLHAAAAHADAGADRIDAAVVRQHGDLGAAAGIAGHRLDLDDAVVDLRHLLGEQLGHEVGMRARQEDLRPARLLAHALPERTHAVAVAEGLARQQLVAPQHGLSATEIDADVSELDALDQAVDDLALAVLVLVELTLALGLAHLLHDHLLGRLGGDAAKIDGRQLVDDELAGLDLRVEPLRHRQRQLRRLVLDRLHRLAIAHQTDLAVLAIDARADVVLVPVFRATGLLDGLLHRFQHLVALDALLAGDGIGHLEQLEPGNGNGRVHHYLLCLVNADSPSRR